MTCSFIAAQVLSSERQAHLVPGDVAVGGGGHALVKEAEAGVEADETVLAGEHQAGAAGGAVVGDDLPQQTGGVAMALAGGGGVDAEDHPPGAVRVMHARIVVHGVGQVGQVGGEAVDHGDEFAVRGPAALRGPVDEQPEAVGVRGQPTAQGLAARGLGCGETGGLQRGDGIQIIQRSMANQHGHHGTARRLGTTSADALRMFITTFNEEGGFPYPVRLSREEAVP